MGGIGSKRESPNDIDHHQHEATLTAASKDTPRDIDLGRYPPHLDSISVSFLTPTVLLSGSHSCTIREEEAS